jgi:hypothetical protein
MMPDSIRAESQVTLHDSCNQCCCFNFRGKRSPVVKAASQAKKIHKPHTPRKVERTTTQIHLDVTIPDDVEFVQDYKVSPRKEL